MKLKIVCSISMFVLLATCAPKAAPSATAPTGKWSADYGPDAQRRDPVTLDLRWENAILRGTVHAGPRSLDISQALFTPETGAIQIQFDAQANGRAVHYVVDGKVEGNEIRGSWSHDDQKGDFHVTKQQQ